MRHWLETRRLRESSDSVLPYSSSMNDLKLLKPFMSFNLLKECLEKKKSASQ